MVASKIFCIYPRKYRIFTKNKDMINITEITRISFADMINKHILELLDDKNIPPVVKLVYGNFSCEVNLNSEEKHDALETLLCD